MMRNYKAVIHEAELLAQSSEAVAAYLKARADYSEADRLADHLDELGEVALRSRSEPLIDLALARYARYMATVKPMFQNGQRCGPIRLAILSNVILGAGPFNSFPEALFDSPAEAANWISEGITEEMVALFDNPKISESFLTHLLERSAPWGGISDPLLAAIVEILSTNKRMRTPMDDGYMDGLAEYNYGAVFNAAWKLSTSVEPTVRWARALGWLYEHLRTEAFSIEDPLALAQRWQLDPLKSDEAMQELEANRQGTLSFSQNVRRGLAGLALSRNPRLLPDLLASEDLGFRAAAYAKGALTSEELSIAYERDGELVFYQALHNPWTMPDAARRDALRRMAWAIVNNDKLKDLTAVNVLNALQEQTAIKHPNWFKLENENPPSNIDASGEPATKEDLHALFETLDDQAGLLAQMKECIDEHYTHPQNGNPSVIREISGEAAIEDDLRAVSDTSEQHTAAQANLLAQLTKATNSLHTRIGWIWWVSLGSLIVSIKHVFI